MRETDREVGERERAFHSDDITFHPLNPLTTALSTRVVSLREKKNLDRRIQTFISGIITRQVDITERNTQAQERHKGIQ